MNNIAPTPHEFEVTMSNIQNKYYTKNEDIETCHAEMDSYILEVLDSLGYKDGVKIFRQTPKWYA